MPPSATDSEAPGSDQLKSATTEPEVSRPLPLSLTQFNSKDPKTQFPNG